MKLMFNSARSIQKKLNVFREYYNTMRPMCVLGTRTPEETWNGTELDEPVLFAERDPIKPAVSVTKKFFEGDPLLPVFRIDIVGRARRYRPAA